MSRLLGTAAVALLGVVVLSSLEVDAAGLAGFALAHRDHLLALLIAALAAPWVKHWFE